MAAWVTASVIRPVKIELLMTVFGLAMMLLVSSSLTSLPWFQRTSTVTRRRPVSGVAGGRIWITPEFSSATWTFVSRV